MMSCIDDVIGIVIYYMIINCSMSGWGVAVHGSKVKVQVFDTIYSTTITLMIESPLLLLCNIGSRKGEGLWSHVILWHSI